MKRLLSLSGMSVIAISLMVSCGGGGGGGGGGDGDDPQENTILQGQFVDAPVTGLSYKTTSGINGETDENGYFKYREGDTVIFSIGNLILGDAKGDTIITPTTLFIDEIIDPQKIREKVKKVTSILLLGKANTSSDKIVLSDQYKKALKNISPINLEETDNLNVNVDIDGDGQEENLQQEVDKKQQEAENHYQETIYNYLIQTLTGLNGRQFYFSTNPQITCQLTYNGGAKFSFNCNNGDGDSPSITKGNGEVRIIEGSGAENILVSADPNEGKICMYNTSEKRQICMVLKKSDSDTGTSPINGNIVDLSYFLKVAQMFEYEKGVDNNQPASGTKVRKDFIKNGKLIEVSYKFNHSNKKPDGKFCELPNDMFVPECYTPREYIIGELTSDSYRETYQCEEEYENGQYNWIEKNRGLNVPLKVEIGKTYDIGVGQLAIEQYIPNQTIPFLHEVGNSRSQYQVLKTKFSDSKGSKYVWFVRGSSGYDTYLQTTTPTIDFNSFIKNVNDWMDRLDTYFIYFKTTDNKKAYINYKFNVNDTFLNNVQNLIDNLPDPFTNVPAECTHFQNL